MLGRISSLHMGKQQTTSTFKRCFGIAVLLLVIFSCTEAFAQKLSFSRPLFIPDLVPPAYPLFWRPPYEEMTASGIGIADLNGDGNLDLATGFYDRWKRAFSSAH